MGHRAYFFASPRKNPLNLAKHKCLDILQIYVRRRDLDFSNSLITLSKHNAWDKEAMCGKHKGLEADSEWKMHKWRANVKVEFLSATWAQKLGSRVVKSKGWLIKRRGGEATAGVSSRRRFGEGGNKPSLHISPKNWKETQSCCLADKWWDFVSAEPSVIYPISLWTTEKITTFYPVKIILSIQTTEVSWIGSYPSW